MSKVKEEKLLKALSEMEAIAKGGAVAGKVPKTTAEANGGLSDEGDKDELAVKGEAPADEDFDDLANAVEKGVKGKKKSLSEWAKEEEEEEAHKGGDMDDDESSEPAEDEDEDESEDEEPAFKKGRKMKKGTLSDVIKSDTAAREAIDVSPFIERLVDEVSDAERDLRKSIVEMQAEQTTHNTVMRKSVVALGNLVLEIKKSLDAIQTQPAGARKSVISKSEIHERFEGEGSQQEFSKSDVLEAMIGLVQAGRLNPLDVARYESTNSMEPNVAKAIEGVLKKSA